MSHYETVLILRQDLSPSQAESIVAQTQENLKQAKARLDRAEAWGLRTLAYPIRKNRKGHYFIINHTNEPATTQEMQRILRLNEDLLRILTIKTTQPHTQPTPISARMKGEQETSEGSGKSSFSTPRSTPRSTPESTARPTPSTVETEEALTSETDDTPTTHPEPQETS